MPKRSLPAFENERVRLRLLCSDDLPLTLRWRNQDHIRRWFFFSDLIAPEQHAHWFEQYQERDDDFVFIIEDIQAGGQPVGQVALYHIDWGEKRAEFGRLMIGEASAAGKGLAFAATQLVLKVAFQDLALRETYLEVYADNVRAITIYEAMGFQTIAQREDIRIMSITSARYIWKAARKSPAGSEPARGLEPAK
jgi:RimJ/RimL family protein N-acetyltransferase